MKRIVCIAAAALAMSCGTEAEFDAQGSFEATEVVVSAEAAGRILWFDAEEGTAVEPGARIGQIDTLQLDLQRRQLEAQQAALLASRPDIRAQAAALREQIAKQERELTRVQNLLRDGAATTKQRDDIEAQIRILQSQLSAALSSLDKSTVTIDGNAAVVEAQIAALDDRITRCRIASPIAGVVLTKYAEAGELAAVGKPLLKVADLEHLYLRAYFTSEQLAAIRVGDAVTVTADFGGDQRYDYEGRIAWISPESEFTPKTIQTRDSRANLVYAAKIAVQNDGRLKIGLAGEVRLHDGSH
ncbi:HlyD family efflux transporter periplasmic adaptor subunit [uncultured Alistipes sp.]|uniref:HlyD family secretion protein n=1 Tax=uncultured Alistipes sp. TaxID=538949 RepID=UPI002605600C|nr:HlyD family efflux transporter periplasmic adaptor subunit [uncultured Alistipes sp.]